MLSAVSPNQDSKKELVDIPHEVAGLTPSGITINILPIPDVCVISDIAILIPPLAAILLIICTLFAVRLFIFFNHDTV